MRFASPLTGIPAGFVAVSLVWGGPELGGPVRPLALLSLVFSGAMFGFFFAWVCSTMWGLDATDPNVAIAAMQAMNASVRNWVFAPFFFGTPVLLALTAAVAMKVGARMTAVHLGVACLLYVLGAMLPTFTFNVTLNEALAVVETPLEPAAAKEAWRNYSGAWQFWNIVRTIFAGAVFALVGWGLIDLGALLAEKVARKRSAMRGPGSQ